MNTTISILSTLWLLSALTQLYYWLVIAWRLPGHKTRIRPASEPVSVIICTNQITDQLKSLLNDILNQQYPNFELILVNDGPNASVQDMVATLTPKHENLHLINFDTSTKHTDGKKAPLAAGIAASNHEWLLLTDADCSVQPGWIQSMMDSASKKKPIVLGYGPLKPTSGIVNAISVFDTAMIAIQYMSFALKGWPYMGVGRNLLYSKSLYNAAGGFEDHMDLPSGDDDLFVQSVAGPNNVAVNLDPQSYVYSTSKETWSSLIDQKRRHVSTSDRYKRGLKMRIGATGLSFILLWLGGVAFVTQLAAVPIALFGVVAGIQWAIFALIAQRIDSGLKRSPTMTRFIPLYPMWAILYAVFLTFVGIIALFGRPPTTWNRS